MPEQDLRAGDGGVVEGGCERAPASRTHRRGLCTRQRYKGTQGTYILVNCIHFVRIQLEPHIKSKW